MFDELVERVEPDPRQASPRDKANFRAIGSRPVDEPRARLRRARQLPTTRERRRHARSPGGDTDARHVAEDAVVEDVVAEGLGFELRREPEQWMQERGSSSWRGRRVCVMTARRQPVPLGRSGRGAEPQRPRVVRLHRRGRPLEPSSVLLLANILVLIGPSSSSASTAVRFGGLPSALAAPWARTIHPRRSRQRTIGQCRGPTETNWAQHPRRRMRDERAQAHRPP